MQNKSKKWYEKAEMWDMAVTDSMEIVERLKKRIEELKARPDMGQDEDRDIKIEIYILQKILERKK